MGDMGEMFREMKRHAKNKRADNTLSSTLKLEKAGVKFESKNNGAHLVVFGFNDAFDFWPSTGLFINRRTKRKSRGVKNLLRKLGHK